MSFLTNYWRAIVLVLAPIIYLPIMYANHDDSNVKAFRCLYVVMIMSTFWITESLPLPITGMIPMVAFPLLDILGTDDVSFFVLVDQSIMIACIFRSANNI